MGESCGTVGFYMWEGRRGLEGWRLMWLGVFGLIYGGGVVSVSVRLTFCFAYSYLIIKFFSPGNFQKFLRIINEF